MRRAPKFLRAALEQFFPGPDKTLVLGVFQDKDWPTMCKLLAPLAARIRTVPIASERSAAPAGWPPPAGVQPRRQGCRR